MTKLAELESKAFGSHYIYIDDAKRFVVEWYDHGRNAPYQSANMIILDSEARSTLAQALGQSRDMAEPQLANTLQERFRSYFELRDFLDLHGLAYRHEVDFQP